MLAFEETSFQDLSLQEFELKDLKNYHVLCLKRDEDAVSTALKQIPSRRRPQCKRAGQGQGLRHYMSPEELTPRWFKYIPHTGIAQSPSAQNLACFNGLGLWGGCAGG